MVNLLERVHTDFKEEIKQYAEEESKGNEFKEYGIGLVITVRLEQNLLKRGIFKIYLRRMA